MIYGLINGARGAGYVIGGVAGVELLKAGPVASSARWSYGTQYGAVIVFTGISALLGGWVSVWRICGSVTRRSWRLRACR